MVSNIFTLLVLPALALCAPHAHHRRSHTVARDDSYQEVQRNASAGQVFLKNSCDYAVSVEPFPGPGCDSGEGGEIEAGATWNDTLSTCATGNSVLKVYKVGESVPMQFEYGVDQNNVWYDMSFIDCLASGYDFSKCAGAGWSMKSESDCHAYKCDGGEECCTQGYCDPYATGVDPAPNTGCGPDQGYTDSSAMGITIELCASNDD